MEDLSFAAALVLRGLRGLRALSGVGAFVGVPGALRLGHRRRSSRPAARCGTRSTAPPCRARPSRATTRCTARGGPGRPRRGRRHRCGCRPPPASSPLPSSLLASPSSPFAVVVARLVPVIRRRVTSSGWGSRPPWSSRGQGRPMARRWRRRRHRRRRAGARRPTGRVRHGSLTQGPPGLASASWSRTPAAWRSRTEYLGTRAARRPTSDRRTQAGTGSD